MLLGTLSQFHIIGVSISYLGTWEGEVLAEALIETKLCEIEILAFYKDPMPGCRFRSRNDVIR